MAENRPESGIEPPNDLRSSMRETMQDGVALLNAEMRLLMAETAENLRSQITAVILVVVAGVFGLIGIILAAVAAAWFLADYLDNAGLAYLIVAGLVLVGAAVIFFIGRNKLSFDHLIPHRFLRSVADLRFNRRARRHG